MQFCFSMGIQHLVCNIQILIWSLISQLTSTKDWIWWTRCSDLLKEKVRSSTNIPVIFPMLLSIVRKMNTCYMLQIPRQTVSFCVCVMKMTRVLQQSSVHYHCAKRQCKELCPSLMSRDFILFFYYFCWPATDW